MNDIIQEYIENFFYLDIETIPTGEPISVEEWLKEAPKSYSAKKQQEWAENKSTEEYRKRSLNSVQGRLVSVGIAVNSDADFIDKVTVIKYNKSEEKMINELANFIVSYDKWVTYGWVGKNIKEFDMVWLLHRFLKYGHTHLVQSLPTDGRDKRLVDIADLFSFTAYKKYYSMGDICSYLGISCKTDMDGSMVLDTFNEGRLNDIYEYNAEDVWTNRKVHNIFRGGEL